MRSDSIRRAAAEGLGTMLLVAGVVGSGIMAQSEAWAMAPSAAMVRSQGALEPIASL